MERSFVEIIAAKRDKLPLSSEEIQRFVRSYCSGAVADYQMSALLMAAFLNGLNDDECMALTQAMLHSGTVVTLDEVPGFKVDKHSTGGVGDNVSLMLAAPSTSSKPSPAFAPTSRSHAFAKSFETSAPASSVKRRTWRPQTSEFTAFAT